MIHFSKAQKDYLKYHINFHLKHKISFAYHISRNWLSGNAFYTSHASKPKILSSDSSIYWPWSVLIDKSITLVNFHANENQHNHTYNFVRKYKYSMYLVHHIIYNNVTGKSYLKSKQSLPNNFCIKSNERLQHHVN